MIDGGPLRTSRPAGRQGVYEEEPVRYQPEEPQVAESATVMEQQQPRPAQRPQRQEEPVEQVVPRRPRNLSWVKWLGGVVVVISLVAATLLLIPKLYGDIATTATIDSGKYQAVFLSNGQVYFGKLTVVSADYMKLTSVYYLERQLTTNGTTTDDESETDTAVNPTGDNNNFQLLKYSDVLYGSEDAMVISRDDIIRYENLRPDGVVAKAIANRRS